MNILISGLGGGLDCVNASLPYYFLKEENTVLGSVRPIPQKDLKNIVRFSDNGCWVYSNSVINYARRKPEPQLASLLNKSLAFFSAIPEESERLSAAFNQVKKERDLETLLFIDGGGDSLILTPDDGIKESENTDPFEGGDAITLQALEKVPCSYLGVISVGLDISEKAFHTNIERLAQQKGYLGRMNMATGQKEDYALPINLEFNQNALNNYFKLAENILVLTPQDLQDPKKIKSHTAVVTYHALKGNFGLQRTYVEWEPQINDQPGVIVKPEHQWMYFLSPEKIQQLKRKLNPKH